jgi:hypothetical protein
LVAGCVDGDEATKARTAFELNHLVGCVTSWQWVIHGDTKDYRAGVVKHLCAMDRHKKAMQFALCGRGDEIGTELGGEGVRLTPHGCGVRCCPRCSRRSGHRFLKRIGAHLEASDHGQIDHIVLTQPVRGNEPVDLARRRFEGAWKLFYRCLRRVGMKSALLTQHVKPRETWGWHFHGHCIVEWKEGTNVEAAHAALEVCWQKASKEESGREKALFRREVCGPGLALGKGGFGGQGEFWGQPEGAVERVLQYAIRDVVQGCEEWVTKLQSDEDVGAFVEVLTDAKLHRLFGGWRKKVESGEVTEPDIEPKHEDALPAGALKKVGSSWLNLGSVEGLFERARAQDPMSLSVLMRLTSMYSNRGKLCQRLAVVQKSVAGLRRAG